VGTHLPWLSSLAFSFVVSVLVGLEVNLFQMWSLQCDGMTVVSGFFVTDSQPPGFVWFCDVDSSPRDFVRFCDAVSLPPGQGTHISMLSVSKLIHISISLSILAAWRKLSIKYYCHMYVHNCSICWCLCASQCKVQSNAEAPDNINCFA
jgi:hypothetical protein